MSIIKLTLLYEGSLGEKRLSTLFDSGANLSCINEDEIVGLENLIKLHTPLKMATAAKGHFIEVTHCTRLGFYIDDIPLSDEFLVIPGLSEEVVIGAATMQKWRMKLDFDYEKVIVDPKVAKLQLI